MFVILIQTNTATYSTMLFFTLHVFGQLWLVVILLEPAGVAGTLRFGEERVRSAQDDVH